MGMAASPQVPAQAEHLRHAGAGTAVGWAGGEEGAAETRRKRELSAGECRGRPRRRGAAGKDASPLPLQGSLPARWSLAHGDTVQARGWPTRTARGRPPPGPWGQGPLCTARRAQGQQLRPSPSSAIPPAAPSFPGAQARGCIPASPPAGRRASPPLPWPQAPLGTAGEGSSPPSLGMPGGGDGAMGAGGRRTSRQREAGGRCQPTLCQHPFPAITAAAPAAV